MTSIGQKYRLAKEYERDMGYVQKERDGRERLSDNVGQWLASEARRVKFTSPGAELGNTAIFQRDRQVPQLHVQHH